MILGPERKVLVLKYIIPRLFKFNLKEELIFIKSCSLLMVYATLAYIRHFIFAGCDPCYLVTN
jgi:hypothetical protein